MTAPLTFGSWLKRRRQGLGLTQKELARQVGYAPVTLRKVEADELRPSGQMAKKLAEALELTPEEQIQFVRFARDEVYWDDLTLPDRAASPRIPTAHPMEQADSAPDDLPEQPALADVVLSKSRHNLPALTTVLLGREEELAELGQLLANPATRLVTILSAGGMGKSSLAVAAAWQQIDHFDDGVCWVPLAPLAEAKDLVLAIATALGLPLQGGRIPERQVGDFLRARHLLLVLDNFEHLLDSVPLIGELLSAAPQLWILVTSRRRLKLSSETVVFLDGLRAPAEPGDDAQSYPAVQMFLLHSRRMRGHYEPTEQDMAGIAAVCRLVHGMPLGILLSAAWTRVLSPAEVAGEIAKDQDFLQTDMPDVPARQRSLRAVFLHTWSKLNTGEREVFMRLSVFRGGASLEAAQHVTGATVGVLATLIDNALLRRLPSGRYDIHELLRQFAQEQLEQDSQIAQAAHDAHSSYYAGFMQERSSAITGAAQQRILQEISAEMDNIRAAWVWAAARLDVDNIRLATYTLYQFTDFRGGYREGIELFEQAIAALDAAPPSAQHDMLLALLCALNGWNYIRIGDYETSAAVFARSAALYAALNTPPPPGFGTDPLIGLAFLATVRGDYTEALNLARTACMRAAERGDTANLQIGNYTLASAYYSLGQFAAAGQEARRAYQFASADGNQAMMAYVAIVLGDVARAEGQLAAADKYYQRCYGLHSSLDNPEGMAVALVRLAELTAGRNDYSRAAALFEQSIFLYRKLNDPGGLAKSLHDLGDMALGSGDDAQAGTCFQEALQLAVEIRWLPLVLLQFTAIGELLYRRGDVELATIAWRTVAAHPAADSMMQQRAQAKLAGAVKQPAGQRAAKIDGSSDPFVLATVLQERLADADVVAVPPEVVQLRPLRRLAPGALNQPMIEPLSERELEILRLLALGLSNQEIAEALTLVVGTVKAHNHHIFAKLGVSNRVQALARARELNYLE